MPDHNALVITHGSCPDGSCAAWIAHRALTSKGARVLIHRGRYGDPPPIEAARGVMVFMFDFCYAPAEMEQLAEVASVIRCEDHHKTAAERCGYLDWCHFDMERSGAGLAWDFFHHGEHVQVPRPWLVDYVEDRDLWRFALPRSREVADLTASTPEDVEAWEELAALSFEEALVQAAGVRRRVDYAADLFRRNAIPTRWRVGDREHVVPVVNAPYFYASRVLEPLVEAAAPPAFAASWSIDDRGYFYWSLRSTDHGIDVSAVASQHGGGGHRNAAGFQGPRWPDGVARPWL